MLKELVRTQSVQLTRKALAAFLVLFSSSTVVGFQGLMQNVSIVQCGATSCATVSASSATVGWLSANLNLQKAKLTIKSRTDTKITEYNVNEIYFDNGAQRIYMHGVAELQNAEAFYDLKSEQLKVFTN